MNEQALERFRKACGLSAPLVLECEDPSRSATASADRTFDCPFVLVGRHPRSELLLEDGQVSRRHAFLQAIAGRILVTDLQSRGKVYWEGEEAPRSQGWLDQAGFIQVGPYRIRRSGCGVSENQEGVSPAGLAPFDQEGHDADPVLRAALELPIRVNDGPSLWPVQGQLAMVGRSDLCQLVLTDDSVSRFHAALVPTPSGLWVVDLLAREGLHVNGERVRWAWLADGDTLRMGRFTFIVRYETPPDQTTRQDVPLEAGASPAERPGTELAVSMGHSDNGRSALAVRPGGRSRAGLKVVTSPPTFMSAALVPSGGEVWEPAIPSPPIPGAIWQQQIQLMELFHNDMILMVEMFVAMHREHLASVRDELGKVQHLTRELGALQAKLAESSESADASLTAGVDRPFQERGPVGDKDRRKRYKKFVLKEPRRASNRTESKPPKAAGGPGVTRPKVPSAKGPRPTVSDGSSAQDSAQIHALLTQRITELQRERQGYWQRILSAINKS